MKIISSRKGRRPVKIAASSGRPEYTRIARLGEFDNGHVLRGNWKKRTISEAEEEAKQASIKKPDTVFYVQRDDVMDSCTDIRWYNGQSYPNSEIRWVDGRYRPVSESTSIDCADSAPESEYYEDDVVDVEQEFTSRDTAVNGPQGKLPAIFKLISIPDGSLVLDYGGGKPEAEAIAQAYLAQFNATEALYDPFNQTPAHNRAVVKLCRSNGGADIAVCSNVLNVIKERDVRINVLNNIRKLVSSSGTVYITVYEGSGSGQGSATQKNTSYQNNRKTASYLEEVQEVFPDAKRRGKLIIAHPSVSAVRSAQSLPSRYWEPGSEDFEAREISQHELDNIYQYLDECGSYTDYNQKVEDVAEQLNVSTDQAETIVWGWSMDRQQQSLEFDSSVESAQSIPDNAALKSEIYEAAKQVMLSDDFAFPEEDIPSLLYVDIRPAEGGIIIEVRAEVSYSGQRKLGMALDQIVKKYDSDAYFDDADAGIMEAYLQTVNSSTGSVNIMSSYYDVPDLPIDPPEGPEYFEVPDSEETIELTLADEPIIVDEDGAWEFENADCSWATSDSGEEEHFSSEYPDLLLDDAYNIIDQSIELLTPYIPSAEGKYAISCTLSLKYHISGVGSRITDMWSDESGSDYDEEVSTDDAEVTYDDRASVVENFTFSEL